MLNQKFSMAVAVGLLAFNANADQAELGSELAAGKGCVACHGVDGVATAPAYPNLAGQWKRYLRLQLVAYRSGKRDNAVMNGFAQSLSDQEIRALAEFYGDR